MMERAMHVYDIYHHPVFGDEAVRRGFSWSAFLFPPVWAVWRGLGWITLLLVSASTLMFDIAEFTGFLAETPALQVPVLLLLMAAIGWFPGVVGYRWHARHLRDCQFVFKCTIVASGRRQAIRAANDDRYSWAMRVASF